MYCTNCGHVIDDNVTECPYCKSTQVVLDTDYENPAPQLSEFRKFSQSVGKTIGKGLGIGLNIGLDIGRGIKDGIIDEINKKRN
jgi:hypothetical protein